MFELKMRSEVHNVCLSEDEALNKEFLRPLISLVIKIDVTESFIKLIIAGKVWQLLQSKFPA